MCSDTRLDSSAFPHIVDEIVQSSPPDVLATFRGMSRRFRALVDDLTASHLVVEGVSLTIFPAAAIHNGERTLMRYAEWVLPQLC